MNPTATRTPFRFVVRDQARLPDFFLPEAEGVAVAGTDLMRAAELSHGPHRKLRWRMMNENWGRSADGDLEVAKLGDYWFITRKRGDLKASETLVEAFGRAPFCTAECRGAMLLAEYCNPKVGRLLPGHWMKIQ
jgi:hypothetical protein